MEKMKIRMEATYDVAERIKDADLERFLFRTYPAHQNTFAM